MRIPPVVLLLFLPIVTARAGDPVVDAAAEVVAAFGAKEGARLKDLALREEPDPWMVAEEVCGRGATDAARAFAEALGSEALVAAVRRLCERPPSNELRAEMVRLRELMLARKYAEAAAVVPVSLPEADDLTTILLLGYSGVALVRTGDGARGGAALESAAMAAEAAGWLRRASRFTILRVEAKGRSDLAGRLACAKQAEALSRKAAPKAEHALVLRVLAALLAESGDTRAGVRANLEAAEILLALGDKQAASECLVFAAVGTQLANDDAEAVKLFRRAADVAGEAGVRDRQLFALRQLVGLMDLGKEPDAARAICAEGLALSGPADRVFFRRILVAIEVFPQNWTGLLARAADLESAAREADDPAALTHACAMRGMACRYLGRREEAIAAAEESVRLLGRITDPTARNDQAGPTALLLLDLGRPRDAIPFLAAAAAQEQVRDAAMGAASVGPQLRAHHYYQLSEARRMTGDAAGALEDARSSLRFAAGNAALEGNGWRSVGRACLSLGDVAGALDAFERAVAIAESGGEANPLAEALDLLAGTHDDLGNPERALDLYERALALRRKLGYPRPTAIALLNLATHCARSGKDERALEAAREALEFTVRTEQPHLEVTARATLATALRHLGREEEAITELRKAIDVGERTSSPIATALQNLGALLAKRGEHEEAEVLLRRAVEVAEAADDARFLALGSLGRVLIECDRAAEAIPLLKEAVELSARRFDRLSEEDAARARAEGPKAFRSGFEAAMAAGSPDDALFFADAARGRALLVSLGGRDALRRTVVPEQLRGLETAALEKRAHAYRKLDEAVAEGRRGEIQTLRKQLDEADGDLVAATARIQREARRAADLYCPPPATVAAIRERLAPFEAMVLFSETPARHGAIVITRDSARLVDVAPFAEPDGDPGERWHEPFVRPLALPDSATRILLSPPEGWTLLPWCLAFPGREVVYVPSATTYLVLGSEGGPGGGKVLALGDPEPAAALPGRSRPAALKAAREEAAAVGDRALLGPAATESAFREALLEERSWRALHFACHGLVRTDRPLLSALALAPDAKNDGLLTVHDLLGLPLRADLVVLSACETARGREYGGEGVFGFTRAVLYAGSPRAIVSLWKVDDAATKALMTRFYELWRTMPASRALLESQRFVASKEGWRDPKYWAAWQLWGVP